MAKRGKREVKIIDGIAYQKCTKCEEWFPATSEWFYLDQKRKKLRCDCRICGKITHRKYCMANEEKLKKYRQDNKEKIALNSKRWRENNPEKVKQNQKRNNNTKKRKKYQAKWQQNNKEKISKKTKKYHSGKSLFKTYAHKLTVEEDPIEDENGHLLVKCAYCGRYFYPIVVNIRARIRRLSEGHGECRLYCSDGCKVACPIFNKHKYPKGYKKASSREVDPLIRQMCLARDNYECQRCGVSITNAELHVHHIEGAVQQPMLANDVGNTITLCKSCHKWVHSQEGCTPYDLRCKK